MRINANARRLPTGVPVIDIPLPAITLSAVELLRLLRQKFPDEYRAVGLEIIVANGAQADAGGITDAN